MSEAPSPPPCPVCKASAETAHNTMLDRGTRYRRRALVCSECGNVYVDVNADDDAAKRGPQRDPPGKTKNRDETV